MSFNEPTFLFIFLPLLLALHVAIPRRLPGGPHLRNGLLLVASLIFYVWGGKQFVFVLGSAVVFNHLMALGIERRRGTPAGRRRLALAVAANLGVLVGFKYSRFIAINLNDLLDALRPGSPAAVPVPELIVPLGISFFTFTAIGYVVDVHRGDAPAEKNLWRSALYLLLFPKVIAGPITRYRDMAGQLGDRAVTREGFASGVRRFIIGLAKKTIVAATVAAPADKIFAIPTAELTPALAWLGLVCYTVQIYFDFSGYTDMAIGVGRMLGFSLPENFEYPYLAESIRDFWRRWHISLSSWLRDYLYIPMGGSRGAPWRVYSNLVTVFVLCGLWHGASWTFIVWGLYYGVFLVLERIGLGSALEKSPRALRHAYALAVIMGGWVLFRAATLPDALGYFGALAGLAGGQGVQDGAAAYVDKMLVLAIIAGAIGSMPIVPALAAWRDRRLAAAGSQGRATAAVEATWALGGVLLLAALLLAAQMGVAANTYSPFIYRQF